MGSVLDWMMEAVQGSQGQQQPATGGQGDFIPYDAIQQNFAKSVSDQVDLSGEQVEEQTAGIGQDIDQDTLDQAMMLASEISNPGAFSRVAAGVAEGLMQSPYARNRIIGASMAKSLGYNDEQVQKKISLSTQVAQLGAAMLDQKRRKLELADYPEEQRLKNEQARANIEATRQNIVTSQEAVESHRLSRRLTDFQLGQAQEKAKFTRELTALEYSQEQAKTREAEAKAAMDEAILQNSPEVTRLSNEYLKLRNDSTKEQMETNKAHREYFQAQAKHELALIKKAESSGSVSTEMAEYLYKDAENASKNMAAAVEMENKLLTRKQTILATMASAYPSDKYGPGKLPLPPKGQGLLNEINRIDTDLREIDQWKLDAHNSRENFRKFVLGKQGRPYGMLGYKPQPQTAPPGSSAPPAAAETQTAAPPAGQEEPQSLNDWPEE